MEKRDAPQTTVCVTERLSSVIQRKVRYIDLPTPIYRAILRLTGNSRWMTNGLIV